MLSYNYGRGAYVRYNYNNRYYPKNWTKNPYDNFGYKSYYKPYKYNNPTTVFKCETGNTRTNAYQRPYRKTRVVTAKREILTVPSPQKELPAESTAKSTTPITLQMKLCRLIKIVEIISETNFVMSGVNENASAWDNPRPWNIFETIRSQLPDEPLYVLLARIVQSCPSASPFRRIIPETFPKNLGGHLTNKEWFCKMSYARPYIHPDYPSPAFEYGNFDRDCPDCMFAQYD